MVTKFENCQTEAFTTAVMQAALSDRAMTLNAVRTRFSPAMAFLGRLGMGPWEPTAETWSSLKPNRSRKILRARVLLRRVLIDVSPSHAAEMKPPRRIDGASTRYEEAWTLDPTCTRRRPAVVTSHPPSVFSRCNSAASLKAYKYEMTRCQAGFARERGGTRARGRLAIDTARRDTTRNDTSLLGDCRQPRIDISDRPASTEYMCNGNRCLGKTARRILRANMTIC